MGKIKIVCFLMIVLLTGCGGKGQQPEAFVSSGEPAGLDETGGESAAGSFFTAETDVPMEDGTPGGPDTAQPEDGGGADTNAVGNLKLLWKEPQGRYRVYEKVFLRGGLHIYGELFLPEGDGPFPTVICAHGYAGNLTHMERYAERFAGSGIASYIFDFTGGGDEILSDGEMKDMSVLTEAADLSAVLSGVRDLPGVDPDRVFLLGESQGGYVATCAAAEAADDVRGLILFFPAYEIREEAQWVFDRYGGKIPETITSEGHTIGRRYIEDALHTDIFSYLSKYSGPVMIVHGTEDEIVPPAYSEKAAELFPDAVLYIREGAHHGFFDEDFEFSCVKSVEFVREKS